MLVFLAYDSGGWKLENKAAESAQHLANVLFPGGGRYEVRQTKCASARLSSSSSKATNAILGSHLMTSLEWPIDQPANALII